MTYKPFSLNPGHSDPSSPGSTWESTISRPVLHSPSDPPGADSQEHHPALTSLLLAPCLPGGEEVPLSSGKKYRASRGQWPWGQHGEDHMERMSTWQVSVCRQQRGGTLQRGFPEEGVGIRRFLVDDFSWRTAASQTGHPVLHFRASCF